MPLSQSLEDKDNSKGKGVRTIRACNRCAQKKIRCIGYEDGTCENCRLASKDGNPTLCTFEDRSSTKKAPPKAYVESLERRLGAMEELLKTLTEKNKQAGGESSGDNESLYRIASRTGSESVGNSPQGTQSPEAIVAEDKLANELEALTMQDVRFFGRASGLHLARSLGWHTPAAASTSSFSPDPALSIVEDWIQAEDRLKNHSIIHPLPPHDLACKLVDAYFQNVNSISSLLHYPSFKRAWDFKFYDTEPSFRGLFFSVCALGARFVQDDPRLVSVEKYSIGYPYYVASTASLTPASGIATLFDIQASCINILFLLGSCTPMTCWTQLGISIRRVIDVGAHRENRSRWNASPLEDQLRKRAIYVLFGLDRQVSATLGRPLALQEEDFDLQEPLNIADNDLDEWNLKGSQFPSPPPPFLPTPIAAAKSLIRLQRIMGRTMRMLYGINRGLNSQKATEAVCDLDSQLNEWLLHVPEHLRWATIDQGSPFLPQAVMLHSAYYTCQILVHRDFLSPGRAKLHPFPSLAICGNAARSLTHLLDTLRLRGRLEQAFFYAPFAAVTAGVVLLINSFAAKNSANLTSSATEDVQRCFEVLTVLSERTFMAKKMDGGFKMLVGTALSAGLPNSVPSVPTRKRTNDEEESPGSDISSSANDLPPLEKQPRVSLSTQRDFRALPLTTEDLSLLSFNSKHSNILPSITTTFNPLPLAPPTNPTATSIQTAPFDFNWPIPTLSPADDTLLQTFYATGTVPIPTTPSNDPSSFLNTDGLSFNSPPSSSGLLGDSSLNAFTNGMSGDYGFNFDPNIPFDWDAIGSFDFDSLSQSFSMPVDRS